MRTVSHPDHNASPATEHRDACPADCDLPDMIRCWSRYLRELRADLDAARGYPDEAVLVVDLRNAEAHAKAPAA
jgi:hypothetical protein